MTTERRLLVLDLENNGALETTLTIIIRGYLPYLFGIFKAIEENRLYTKLLDRIGVLLLSHQSIELNIFEC